MRILILNQCFYPDIAATAQYAGDLASSLAGRGHDVTVLASRRAYSEPATVFSKNERWKGCKIIRVPCLALGKQTKWRRILDFGSFFASCALHLSLLAGFDIVIGLTSPPLISFLAALFVKIKGGRFIFWVMDLNPDEALAAGWLSDGSTAAAVLKKFLLISLNAAESVVVLDRFMRDRVIAKGISAEKVWIIPVWSHSEIVRFDDAGRRAFRRKHRLTDKFVVMYSGNHTTCHPLDTALHAALRSREDSHIVFCFVGGGSEYSKVLDFSRLHHLANIVCLPYQPISHLSASLSAADLHLVVMGNPYVGIVHTCKIYNIMRVGSPVAYIGPAESHVGDISAAYPHAPLFPFRHGDVEQLTETIRTASRYTVPNEQIRHAGDNFSQDRLVTKFAELIEALHGLSPVIEKRAIEKPAGDVAAAAQPEMPSFASVTRMSR